MAAGAGARESPTADAPGGSGAGVFESASVGAESGGRDVEDGSGGALGIAALAPVIGANPGSSALTAGTCEASAASAAFFSPPRPIARPPSCVQVSP